MNGRRVASYIGTVAVTVIAAVGSYDHMRELALEAGQPAFLAALLPLSVDGMILVATLALGDGRRSSWSAWLAFLVGVAASLAANVIVAEPDATSRVVSAWPAVALLLTVEVLARSGKPAAVPMPIADAVPISKPADVPMPIPAVPMPISKPAMPIPAMPMPIMRWVSVPTGSASLNIIPAQQPMPIADPDPVADVVPIAERAPRKTRKPVVPAHPERADSAIRTNAEIVKRADELKPQLGTWQKVADELGISIRKLQNIRNAADVVKAG